MSARADVLDAIADAVLRVSRPHPVRVGVDGRSAAGKTTLCQDLSAVLAARGRHVLRASIDDFHRPGPLGPGGDRRCRTRLWDARNDVAYPEAWHEFPRDGLLIAEAAFLFRPELADHWDVTIWLDVSFETVLERARRRDVAWVGSEDEVVARYRSFWIPTHELYERRTGPQERADVVVHNEHFEEPRLTRLRLR